VGRKKHKYTGRLRVNKKIMGYSYVCPSDGLVRLGYYCARCRPATRLDYRSIQHLFKGTKKRFDKEHVDLADATVGGEHVPGGCAVLDILDSTADLTHYSLTALMLVVDLSGA